jgi:hypothetical protein
MGNPKARHAISATSGGDGGSRAARVQIIPRAAEAARRRLGSGVDGRVRAVSDPAALRNHGRQVEHGWQQWA